MTETDIMRLIQVALSAMGHRVFRNNVAKAWVGIYAGRSADGTVVLKNARPLHAGLCVGSADLIGFTSSGKFLAIEVKTETGRATPEQLNFLETVRRFGGIAGIARSVEDAKGLLNADTNI